MKSYEEMLEEAYAKIKVINTGERFEIPKVESFIQGGFTVVKNFVQIAEKLRRDPKHMLKFFTRELAAPGSMEGSNAVFQTKVSAKLVQQKLEEYVKEFVLCKECKRPDTRLVKEDRVLVMKCDACGAKCAVKQLK